MKRAPHVVEIERVVVEAGKIDLQLATLVRRKVESAVLTSLQSQEAGLDATTMERVSQRAGEGAAGALTQGGG